MHQSTTGHTGLLTFAVQDKLVRQRFLVALFLKFSVFSLFITLIYCEFMESVQAVHAFATLNECGYRPVVNNKDTIMPLNRCSVVSGIVTRLWITRT